MSPPDTVLETVRWKEGKVRILDQRRLPGEECYLELESPEEVIEAIRTLAVRGAPAIGIAGALGLALAASRETGLSGSRFVQALSAAAGALIRSRPTAVNLRWACEKALLAVEEAAAAGEEDGKLLAAVCLRRAGEMLEDDLALSRSMSHYAAQLLPVKGAVISHCNTGGLATAGGGTALGAVFQAVREGKEIFVHVGETRPLLQGARLTAWELERAAIPHSVHCDSAAAWLMQRRRIDAVLVGADRIAENGDTANKVGTYALALAAEESKVPFYVVAPRSSFDLSLETGAGIPIEERAPVEVLEWQGVRAAPPGSGAWNPAFDVTPEHLISAWVTERGVEWPPFLD